MKLQQIETLKEYRDFLRTLRTKQLWEVKPILEEVSSGQALFVDAKRGDLVVATDAQRKRAKQRLILITMELNYRAAMPA